MSIERNVRCDECDDMGDGFPSVQCQTAAAVRRMLRRERGWRYIGGKDYCAGCAQHRDATAAAARGREG